MAFLRQIQYNSLLQSFIFKSHGPSVLVVTKNKKKIKIKTYFVQI